VRAPARSHPCHLLARRTLAEPEPVPDGLGKPDPYRATLAPAQLEPSRPIRGTIDPAKGQVASE
jgi:hypothetical protein